MWTETIVVKVKVLKGNVGGEESNEGCLHIEAKGIVVKVYRMQFR